jgi:DNA ligase-1
LQSKLRIGLAEKTVLAALAHAAVLSEVPKVPPAQLAARLEEV